MSFDQMLRKRVGEVFRKLAMQKECWIEGGHLMPDHVHMMISISPKYAVSQVVGYIGTRTRGRVSDPNQLLRVAHILKAPGSAA